VVGDYAVRCPSPQIALNGICLSQVALESAQNLPLKTTHDNTRARGLRTTVENKNGACGQVQAKAVNIPKSKSHKPFWPVAILAYEVLGERDEPAKGDDYDRSLRNCHTLHSI